MELIHCRNHFYREFAWKTLAGEDKPNKSGRLLDLRRDRWKPVCNIEQLKTTLMKYESRPGKYISVFSFERLYPADIKDDKGKVKAYKGSIDYNSAKINRIYLDFDHETDPQKAINEALIVVNSLYNHGIYCHCYFSGSKGIALYIEFKTINIQPENKKDVLKLFIDIVVEAVKNDSGYDMFQIIDNKKIWNTLDYKVSFDIARVARIPNTQHKSGLYCIPISFGDMRKGLEHIKTVASKPSTTDLDKTISDCMRRNESMETILLNCEKQVIAERKYMIQKKETQQRISDIRKTYSRNVNNNADITDDMIRHAKEVPLANIISNDNRMKCPIHNGNNPTSLYINHEDNWWYCFSCGVGGTTIDFLMKKESLSFKDAVLKLT